MEKIKVPWVLIDIAIENICSQIKCLNKKYKNIYAISRGGYIPGVMLSHRLNIPLTSIIEENTLICDDIADTGTTLKQYESYLNIAVLFKRYNSEVDPLFIGININDNEWRIFPWETEESSKYDN